MVTLVPRREQSSRSATFLTGICLIFLVSCTQKPGQLPSHLSRFPEDLGNNNLALSGLYQDGWTAKNVALNLNQPSGDQDLVLRGMIPNVGDANFRADAEISLDGKVVGRKSVGLGDFEVVVPVQAQVGTRQVTLTFSAAQQLPGGDNRFVTARLAFIGFETDKPGSDIVRGPAIQLGDGWGKVEVYEGETFRWVDNDAQIQITSDKQGDVGLSLLIEPGPGVGGPFLLKALDSAGRQVAAVRVEKRQIVKLYLAAEGGKINDFRLHVDGGGKKTQKDPRILNFRVFRVEREPAANSAPNGG